jgi:hypothetical protein
MAVSNARAQQSTTAALDNKERSEALAQMQLTKILRAYIMQMITGTLESLRLVQGSTACCCDSPCTAALGACSLLGNTKLLSSVKQTSWTRMLQQKQKHASRYLPTTHASIGIHITIINLLFTPVCSLQRCPAIKVCW